MRPESPCKDCQERHFKCHGECDKYAAFQETLSEFNANQAKLQEINSLSRGYIRASIRNMKRSKK